MKKGILTLLVIVLPALGIYAEDTNVDQVEIRALVQKIESKIQSGHVAETNFADEITAFDALIAKHKGEKSDQAAQLSYMKAMLYVEIFKDSAKSGQLMKEIHDNYPDTKYGKSAGQIIEQLAFEEAAKKVRSTLVVGSTFPDFDEKDISGKPLSAANYKGKVVLIDFWATWCGPCRQELPNVIDAYNKLHDKGFEIIGISLDSDKSKLDEFLKAQNMLWPQFYDGLVWKNKLALKYGVDSIPSSYLLDGSGKIIATDLRGDELEKAVSKALEKH